MTCLDVRNRRQHIVLDSVLNHWIRRVDAEDNANGLRLGDVKDRLLGNGAINPKTHTQKLDLFCRGRVPSIQTNGSIFVSSGAEGMSRRISKLVGQYAL